MQDKLRALVRLAEIDASARHIDEQLSGIPIELEERRQAVAALEALVGGQRQQMDQAESLLASQQEALVSRTDMLGRSRAKGAKARNMREAEASERELDAIRRSIKEGEVEKERLETMIAGSRDILVEPLRELEEQKRVLADAEAGTADRLAALRAQGTEITKGREQFATKVPRAVYLRYERIRPKIHPAVVEVKDGVCMGCRIHVAPQLNIQILRGGDFYQCQQCQRFLYSKDAIL